MTKFCPKCGEELVDGANFCKKCGANTQSASPNPAPSFERPVVEKEYKILKIIGYVCAVLIPLIGIIIGIFLATREGNASRHGKFIIILGVIVWIISFLLIR